MSISSINDTVATSLREAGNASYLGYAGPVISQLVEREQTISERLLAYAGDLGANVGEVRTYLSGLGMAVPDEETDSDEDTDDEADEDMDLADQVSALTEAVRSLTGTVNQMATFARRHGFSG